MTTPSHLTNRADNLEFCRMRGREAGEIAVQKFRDTYEAAKLYAGWYEDCERCFASVHKDMTMSPLAAASWSRGFMESVVPIVNDHMSAVSA